MLIEDCKDLADFIEGLVDRVSECSLQLNEHNQLSLHTSWKFHPSETNPKTFYSAAFDHIWKYYQNYANEKMNGTSKKFLKNSKIIQLHADD